MKRLKTYESCEACSLFLWLALLCPDQRRCEAAPATAAIQDMRLLDRFTFVRDDKKGIVKKILRAIYALAEPRKSKRTVGSTKTKRITENGIDFGLTGDVGYIVQITFRILVMQVNGRWQDLVIQRER